jgi:hypothetical protein
MKQVRSLAFLTFIQLTCFSGRIVRYWPQVPLADPILIANRNTVRPRPNPPPNQGDSSRVHPVPAQPQPPPTDMRSSAESVEKWDPWPDGVISKLFSHQFVREHNHLQVHWSCEALGGDKKGSEHAEVWSKGKRAEASSLIAPHSRGMSNVPRLPLALDVFEHDIRGLEDLDR